LIITDELLRARHSLNLNFIVGLQRILRVGHYGGGNRDVLRFRVRPLQDAGSLLQDREGSVCEVTRSMLKKPAEASGRQALTALAADDEIKKKGFDLYCAEKAVRRLTPNITAVKGDLEGYRIVELKDGNWVCDCFHYAQRGDFCEHIYAAQLARKANRSYATEMASSEESSLKCRYCGSPDISRCGFRYNARGISRCYYCHECERKFSLRIVQNQQAIDNVPAEVVWLLNEVGLQVSRLDELLVRLDSKLTQFSAKSAK